MSLIQQLKSFADTSKDVSKLQIAIQQAKDALDIIDLTYESIAKFDIEAITEPTEQTTEQMQGFIRRN